MSAEAQQQVSVLDVEVTNVRVAFGIMAHFLDTAAKRGAFSLEESGKINDALRFLRTDREEPENEEEETPKEVPKKPELGK